MGQKQIGRFQLMRLFGKAYIISICVVIWAGTAAVPVQAQTFADLNAALIDYSKTDTGPVKPCEAMSGFKSSEIVQITAEKISANDKVPAFCRVAGVLDPEIAFEVSLPDKWNGRFYMIGNGGHAGESLNDAMRVSQINEALRLGFAAAQTNTGHDSRKEPGGSFVISNPQKAIDYAYRAVHLTAVTAKDIIKDYYAKPATFAYWNSCSNGIKWPCRASRTGLGKMDVRCFPPCRPRREGSPLHHSDVPPSVRPPPRTRRPTPPSSHRSAASLGDWTAFNS